MATNIHTIHLDKRSSDECRTRASRRRATTAEKKRRQGTRQHGEATQQELTTCEKPVSKPFGNKASPGECCSLGSDTSASHETM